MICESGKCCICEKSIADLCQACGAKKFTNDHTRIEVKWSNGSIMPIGVCHACALEHAGDMAPDVKKGITEAHWKFWESVGGKPDKEIVIV